MARRAAGLLALASPLLPLAAADAAPPRPAPPVYATANYGLTFRSPPGTFYCPLPRDWVGSDHGTVLFLESPGNCGGAGYPSSSRNFERNAARIEVYYAYMVEDEPKPLPRCPGARIRFAGTLRPICIERRGPIVRAEIQARYRMGRSSGPGEAIVTLVTRRERLARDLATFRRFAATVRTCAALWPAENGHPAATVGVGPRCPNVGTF